MKIKCPKCGTPFLPESTRCNDCGWKKKKNSAPYHMLYQRIGGVGKTKNKNMANNELKKMKTGCVNEYKKNK